MAATTRGFLAVIIWAMQYLCISAFLNIEELNEMKYGIEILSDPIIKRQTKSDDIVIVSSKYKQMYECRLPAQAMKFQQESEDEGQSYSGLEISELLKPMHAAPCLVKTKDWWTYEFCYGQHIKQYHTEDSEVKGDVMYLGFYESEFDWNNETAKASKQHKLKRYHSQTYVNGSKCDLNERPREAEVRFMCEEGSGDYIARVDEPQSCNYVLTIHTTRICHHPYLRPAIVSKPQPIKCQPALSPEQYVEYVKAQVSDTKRKVEKISEELKTLDEMLLKDQSPQTEEENGLTPEPENQIEELPGSNENILELGAGETFNSQEATEENDYGEDFWNKIGKSEIEDGPFSKESPEEADSKLSDTVKTEDDDLLGDQGNQKVHFRITRNPDDLIKFVQELKDQTKKKGEDDKDPTTDASTGSSDESTDQDLTAKQEGMVDDEENELIKDFEKELEDVSLPKSKMSEIKREVKEEMEKEFENLIDEAQDELEAEGLKGEFDRNQASKTLATTLNKLISKLEEKDSNEEDRHAAKGSPSRSSKHTGETDEETEGHVKVRVTKINPGSPLHKEMKVREMSGTDPQLRQIQNVVKEQLEKAGLKAEGKIEVKIVTTGSLGDDDDMHWLSEEDTKSFRELLINLLTGGTEEVYKEQQRQQQLEDNYRFVWGESQEEAQSSSSTDSDDMDF
ncbi:protein OS-9 isoform X2 [Heterodontus francisci]|uniref:protein OS-9 isoform X2 n=1 Tax=Heterodontus francisci TaxID=7792 RepID=UPI00355BB4AA